MTAPPIPLAAVGPWPVSTPDGGRRTPNDWPTFSVAAGRPVRLQPGGGDSDASDRTAGPRRLRLTFALEVWGDTVLEVRTAGDGVLVARHVLDHSDCFEVIDIQLTAREVARGVDGGLELSTPSSDPLWLFDAGAPLELAPRLRVQEAAAEREAQLLARMRDLGSLQQFGWKEGCVLDGMLALHRVLPDGGFGDAIDAHLSWNRTPDGGLQYEDPRGRPVGSGFLHGIEAALPFAALVERSPADPLIDAFVEFVDRTRRADGLVIDGDMVSAEGSYTIAYPLAAIARVRGRPDLADRALEQLELRRLRLAEGDVVYLRDEPGGRSFRNWCRAWSWYLLGLARTLEQFEADRRPSGLVAEFARAAAIVLEWQLPDGGWRVFLDEGSTDVDTSGSAGIAAALAVGVRLRIAPPGSAAAVRRAHVALFAWLTDDGLLGGATQANKDGERLQRRDYRVISQMGTGLLAQLHAEVLLAGG